MKSSPPKTLKEAIQITQELRLLINEELDEALASRSEVRVMPKDAERAELRYDARLADQTALTTAEIKKYLLSVYHENPAVAEWGPLPTMIDIQHKDLHSLLLERYRIAVDRSVN